MGHWWDYPSKYVRYKNHSVAKPALTHSKSLVIGLFYFSFLAGKMLHCAEAVPTRGCENRSRVPAALIRNSPRRREGRWGQSPRPPPRLSARGRGL